MQFYICEIKYKLLLYMHKLITLSLVFFVKLSLLGIYTLYYRMYFLSKLYIHIILFNELFYLICYTFLQDRN